MSRQVVEPIKDTGSLTLGYDNTPGKDPYNPNGGQAPYSVDARYHGYPTQLMERPRVPRTIGHEYDQSKEESKFESDQRRSEALNELLNPSIDFNDQEQPQPSVNRHTDRYLSEFEEQKILRQQREAEADIQRFKEERQRQIRERQLEKRQDLHMLQSYNPWGKPGHGAPRGLGSDDHKMQKFLEDSSADAQQPQQQQQQGLTFSRPGHGAPIRTSSGQLVTQLPGDPLIRFQDVKKGRQYVDPIRYKNPQGQQYARELDVHMQQQVMQREVERQHELQAELQTLQYDPYGRPGAGAPNTKLRVQRTVGRFEPELQEYQQPQPQQPPPQPQYDPAEPNSVYDPWGKGYGGPVRDELGNVLRYPFHDKKDGSVLYPSNLDAYKIGVQEQPQQPQQPPYTPRSYTQRDSQPIRGPHGEHIPPSHRYYGQPVPQYQPFGRPGHGAPLVDEQGQLVPSVVGAANFEENGTERQKKALAARIYSKELEQGMIEQTLNRKLELQQRRAPVNDFISEQINRGAVGKPMRDPQTGSLLDQHLPSSDITHIKYKTPRHKFQSVTGYQHLPDFVNTADSYGSELERASEQRAALRRLERLKDAQEAHRHADTFDQMFGRPGGGAPYEPTLRKVKLPEALHHPEQIKNEFKKPVNHYTPVPNTVYVRSNINSNHQNKYEAVVDASQTGDGRYDLPSPILGAHHHQTADRSLPFVRHG